MLRYAAIGLLFAYLPAGTVSAADPEDILEYTAQYEVRYKGRRVARAEFTVTRLAENRYEFRSTTQARGIWRVLSPQAALEISEFETRAGLIAPVRFEYQDGSKKGEDNFSIEFDATSGEIHIDDQEGRQTLALEEGLLDRGSLQVALMRDAAACEVPGPYRYVDDDGERMYRYEQLDDRTAETGIGDLDTVRFSQQSEGSSRTTVLWLAAELAYLPVRLEQIRNGEVQTVFTLEDVAGIERAGDCSSFR